MFRLPRLENWRDALALCLLLVGLQQMASAGYIQGKAHLAQLLIGRSWATSVAAEGQPHRPWPWADTWPVARLLMPEHAVDLYVLSGARGNALAFGPGHETASAMPGQAGVAVIGGHRDTHFAFLEDLRQHSEFAVQLANGEEITYRVSGVQIVDVRLEPLIQAAENDELLLVTCYPFDAVVPGGPFRYVVKARQVGGTALSGWSLPRAGVQETWSL